MKEQEGVIKYTLNHHFKPLTRDVSVSEINAWRTVLFQLQLIGQITGRYEGYGFGNISQRIGQTKKFIISGTQTGGIKSLSKQHYAMIIEALPDKNTLTSIGETKPSSEALTHASVYQQNNAIQSVIHIHCPEIWLNTDKLKLPSISADIAYGTPEMANQVGHLLQQAQTQKKGVFSLLGHQDGIIAFSCSMEKAACSLIKLYAQAIN